MTALRKLLHFISPYRIPALISIALLVSQVFTDLAIPRLIQRIVDEGIKQNDMGVVLQTAALMLGAAALSTFFALGNNSYSVRVAEGMARDLREALFTKIQSFAYGDIDRFTTGNLMAYEAIRLILGHTGGADYRGYFFNPHAARVEKPLAWPLSALKGALVRQFMAKMTAS